MTVGSALGAGHLQARLAKSLFWASAGVVVATYAGFPVALVARGRLRPRAVRAADVTPTVTVVIAAHNEEQGLGDKLLSVLACDYPADRLDVVVASDGSTDGTVRVASGFRDDGVRVLDLPRAARRPP